jgi:sarcosine oxidase subunit gamma
VDRLAARTPLGATAPRRSAIGALAITEIVDTALASVSLRLGAAEAFAAAAGDLFGTALPEPGHWASGETFTLIWTGPDQWFVEAPLDTHDGIDLILKERLGRTASLTDQTDGWVRFDIEGATVVDLLERLCPVPSRRMQTRDATRTLLEHIGCLLICRETGRRFSVLGPRSYAASLHHALCATARSIA